MYVNNVSEGIHNLDIFKKMYSVLLIFILYLFSLFLSLSLSLSIYIYIFIYIKSII